MPEDTTDTPDKPVVHHTELRVYAGRRMVGSKLLHRYYPVPDSGKLDTTAWWDISPKNHRDFPATTPGTVVEVRFADERSYWSSGRNGPTFHSRIARDVNPQVDVWATLDRAAYLEDQARKADPLGEALATVRDTYRNAHPTKRPAILAAIIYEVTRG